MVNNLGKLMLLGWLSACAENQHGYDTPYRLGQAMVIGESKGGRLTTTAESCGTAECNAVLAQCGREAFADVILDENGAVVDVLCYKGNVTVNEIGLGPVDSARAGNNTVLVLDGEDDGLDVTGDVVLDGNNAVVYGQGADVSVIGGLIVDKNNAFVRGVTIQGDVVISKNNAKLTFCDIQGNLTINGNNTTLAECVIHGAILISGNNTVLVQNEIEGTDRIEGKNLTCNANVRLEAADAGLGAGVSCREPSSSP